MSDSTSGRSLILKPEDMKPEWLKVDFLDDYLGDLLDKYKNWPPDELRNYGEVVASFYYDAGQEKVMAMAEHFLGVHDGPGLPSREEVFRKITIQLPDRQRMLASLEGVSQDSFFIEELYPGLMESAGQEVLAWEVYNLVTNQIDQLVSPNESYFGPWGDMVTLASQWTSALIPYKGVALDVLARQRWGSWGESWLTSGNTL